MFWPYMKSNSAILKLVYDLIKVSLQVLCLKLWIDHVHVWKVIWQSSKNPMFTLLDKVRVRLDFLKWWKTIIAEYQADKNNHAS